MKMSIYIAGTLVILTLSCEQRKENRGLSTLNSIDRTVPYDSIPVQDDMRDRTIWQKPYEVIHLFGSLTDKVIADLGAGSGYFSFRFIHEAGKVIAIDIEPELIQLMNQEKQYYRPDLQERFEARLASPTDPKLNDHEVDFIFISNTYTYINNRVNYLNRLVPKLRPGGKIMIVDFKKKLTPVGPAQKSRLAQSEVEQELINAGYDLILSDDHMLEYQYIIIASPSLK